jgi:hypothetical protein
LAEPADRHGWGTDPVSMNEYLERLDGAAALAPAAERIALLTGQSSFVSSALSPGQLAFLETVAPAGCSIVRTGLPFDSAVEEFREVGMVGASWRNTRQVYWSICSAAFRTAVARRLQALMDATSRRLILITGSCGLQLANSAWPLLRVPPDLRVEVAALGPVCFGALRVPVRVIQGRRDGWSRLFYRGKVDGLCECGHLDYWDSEAVRVLLR